MDGNAQIKYFSLFLCMRDQFTQYEFLGLGFDADLQTYGGMREEEIRRDSRHPIFLETVADVRQSDPSLPTGHLVNQQVSLEVEG